MVTPADSTALCNIMIAQPTMGNALQVRWDDLAVTSCALLNPAITYCYYVDNVIPSIVGFGLLQTGRRRRLLSTSVPADSLLDDGLAAIMLWNASWSQGHAALAAGASSAGSLCRDLIHAYRESFCFFFWYYVYSLKTSVARHKQRIHHWRR